MSNNQEIKPADKIIDLYKQGDDPKEKLSKFMKFLEDIDKTVTNKAIGKAIKQGLEATTTTKYAYRKKSVEEPDHKTRLKYIETAIELKKSLKSEYEQLLYDTDLNDEDDDEQIGGAFEWDEDEEPESNTIDE